MPITIPDYDWGLMPDPRPLDEGVNAPLVSDAKFSTRTYTWGRDRLDQDSLPLDKSYTPLGDGHGVHVYILDSGINGLHSDFAGRLGKGFSAFPGSDPYRDCNGHGTHVAGTVAGSPDVGVAPAATLHSVQAFDCFGQALVSFEIQGLKWILANAEKPAVVNASFGGDFPTPPAERLAFQQLLDAGIPVVVAAGNEPIDACGTSPSDIAEAVSVAATDINDQAADFSAYGPCVDIYAPGVKITSTDHDGAPQGATEDGTSMAAPHVTGAIAAHWSAHPTLTSDEVVSAVLDQGVTEVDATPVNAPAHDLVHVESASTADGTVPADTTTGAAVVTPATTTTTFTAFSNGNGPGVWAILIALGLSGVLTHRIVMRHHSGVHR